jgi:hypothetical protein
VEIRNSNKIIKKKDHTKCCRILLNSTTEHTRLNAEVCHNAYWTERVGAVLSTSEILAQTANIKGQESASPSSQTAKTLPHARTSLLSAALCSQRATGYPTWKVTLQHRILEDLVRRENILAHVRGFSQPFNANYMDQSPWESDHGLTGQPISHLSWNSIAHYRLLNSLQLDANMSSHYFIKIHYNITSPTMSRFLIRCFVLCAISSCVLYTQPTRPRSFHHPNNIWWRECMRLLIMQISRSSCNFLTFKSKYSTHHSVLRLPYMLGQYLKTGHIRSSPSVAISFRYSLNSDSVVKQWRKNNQHIIQWQAADRTLLINTLINVYDLTIDFIRKNHIIVTLCARL